MGHLWHKMSWIYLKKLRAPCQISSYFWVFWGKIQLSNGHKVSWFWVGWKILLDLIFPHVGLSSMPFWSKYTDPPTSMICGFKKEHMLKLWPHFLLVGILPSWTIVCIGKNTFFLLFFYGPVPLLSWPKLNWYWWIPMHFQINRIINFNFTNYFLCS